VKRDVVVVIAIAAAAFAIRTYPAWDAVFSSSGVRFLETDAWYHVRLVENQVRNFPSRVTRDPFAAPDGQFVPIAPLFDTVTSTIVRALHGGDATTPEIERVAAWMPPLYGTLAVILVWALAQRLFDRRAGLIAAALLAVLPGHFLDRTMLGFVDHHALEAVLAIGVLYTFVRALPEAPVRMLWPGGIVLGLYLLAWGSGAFLVAILGVWVVATALVARSVEDLRSTAAIGAAAAVVALILVATFQDPSMHRYGSQILALVGLAVASGAVLAAVTAAARGNIGARVAALTALAILAAAGLAVAMAVAPSMVRQVWVDILRLSPDASRMGVLEARPLFLYGGQWNWQQPWLFFRTGFFAGVVALIPFAIRVGRRRLPADILVLVYAVATLVATIGQNRFGYYLVTACALLGGWLATELLDWAGVPHAGDRRPVPRTRLPLAREIAVIVVAGGMFAPNLAPRVLLAERRASYPDYWRDAMQWLNGHTPAPFPASGSGDRYYYARYGPGGILSADYSVMSWWDQGYWIIQQARRVPVANPTQERAAVAGRFYSATTEPEALAIARAERSRFVVSDYELPFRRTPEGTIMGRFQTIVDWTGAAHDPFYEVVYRRAAGDWTPVWIFREPYYRSMAFRLSVLGGAGISSSGGATVITLADRVDANGFRFREIVNETTFDDYETARQMVDAANVPAAIVGLDPWRSVFPIEPLRAFVEVHAVRTSEQKPTETPWVRVFQVR
jgi:dolichyl-diphosphooligosaccharide--protein glycosyltransferase